MVAPVIAPDEIDAMELFELLEKAVEAGRDVREITVAAGSISSKRGDEEKFKVGIMACFVEKQYGANAIAEWAKDVGWEAERVKEYRTVMRYYGWRAIYLFMSNYPNVKAFYSKLRTAQRFDDMEYSLDFIAEQPPESSAESFGIAVAIKLGKPTPPKKYLDIEIPTDCAGEALDKYLRTLINPSSKLRVKVYEVK